MQAWTGKGATVPMAQGAPLVGGSSVPNYLKIMQKLAVSAFGGPSDTRLAQGVPNTSPGLYVWIEVDETNRLIWLSRSSEVKVKVTRPPNLQKWPFSKCISSAIYGARWGLMMDYESLGQYVTSLRPDFSLSVSFSIYGTSNLANRAILHQVWPVSAQQGMIPESCGWCHSLE